MGFRINISEKIALTPAEQAAWEETLTLFSWDAPAFTHVLYDMLNPEGGRSVATFLGPNKVPHWFSMGTNGKRLFIVAERFFSLDLRRRIFGLAHEVCHPMLGHIVASQYYRQRGFIELGFKKLPWSDELANFAQDYVINDMLVESRIGTFIEDGLLDKKIATFKDSWIDAYEKLLKECKKQGNDLNNPFYGDEQTPDTRGGKHRFDFHMGFGEGEPQPQGKGDPGDEHADLMGPDEPITKEQMMAEIEKAQQAAAAGVELARARGKLPAALELFAEKILEPTVDWSDVLKADFARKLGTGAYDFRRPDRRLITRSIIAPGRSGFRCDVIVLGMDSSGSIYAVPKLIERWMGESSGIMEEARPREVHVVWCDAKVQRVDILTDPEDVKAMFYRGAKGGGGTSFVPVFEYAETIPYPIDCMSYLTDGDGTFPDRPPPYPVIWGDISGEPEKYPFGDVVNIPVPA
jgi:predicted metal-dependent peptidase